MTGSQFARAVAEIQGRTQALEIETYFDAELMPVSVRIHLSEIVERAQAILSELHIAVKPTGDSK